MNWIDISLTLKNGMIHWPGDTEFKRKPVKSISKGDRVNLSELSMSAHAGTHIDAPRHYIDKGESAGQLPFDAVIGQARVIAVENEEYITKEELIKHDIRPGERILLKTVNSEKLKRSDKFKKNFVGISKAAAKYFAEKNVRAVGVDYLSVGNFDSGDAVHEILLGAGIWIIEGLDLSEAPPGDCELICLPLKILDSDGAPARAVLRKK